MPMSAFDASEKPVRTLQEVLERSASLAGGLQRPDLSDRLTRALVRLQRPETLIAVVGEFKRGKSSLVNGLLGEGLVPVDDDLATSAITILTYADEASSRVVRFHDGEQTEAECTPAEVRQYVIDDPDSVGFDDVTLAQIFTPNPFLANGVMLVDTPGVGGLSSGYMSTTLAYLRSADAMIFISDASASLSAAELEFLRRACDACPTALMALTKTDLYPDWREIRGIIAAQLSVAELDIELVPVSNEVRDLALAEGDPDLNSESGFPSLLAVIDRVALEPSSELTIAHVRAELGSSLEQLRITASNEIEFLENPARAAAGIRQLEKKRAQLQDLRSGSSRWSTALNDGFADLIGDVDFRFRATVREISRSTEDEIEQTDPVKNWDSLTNDVRVKVADAAEAVIRSLEQGSDRIADRAVEILNETDIALDPVHGTAVVPDVERLWVQKPLPAPTLASRAGTGWAGLRGAQGGVLVIGMMAGLAGIAITTMALAGVGMVFGGKQLFEERKRKATQRRQQARTAVRQFLDDAQFEITKSLRDLSRDLQRKLRDHFSDRLNELHRAYTTSAESLQQTVNKDQHAIAAHLDALRGSLTELDELLQRAGVGAAP